MFITIRLYNLHVYNSNNNKYLFCQMYNTIQQNKNGYLNLTKFMYMGIINNTCWLTLKQLN